MPWKFLQAELPWEQSVVPWPARDVCQCWSHLCSPVSVPPPGHGSSLPCPVPEFPKDLCSVEQLGMSVQSEFLCCSAHLYRSLSHCVCGFSLQVWRNGWGHLYLSLGGDQDEAAELQAGLQDCVLPPGAAGDHQWGRNGQADVCVPWAPQCSQVSAAPCHSPSLDTLTH